MWAEALARFLGREDAEREVLLAATDGKELRALPGKGICRCGSVLHLLDAGPIDF